MPAFNLVNIYMTVIVHTHVC